MTNTRRKIVRLSVIRNERKASEAKNIRTSLFRSAKNASEYHRDDLSGFALITWNRTGEMRTALNPGYGPLAWARMPSECHEALNRHVAADLMQNGKIIVPEDGETDA